MLSNDADGSHHRRKGRILKDPIPGVAHRDLRMDFLCAFAVLNPLVVQASYFLAPPSHSGNLSIPQLFQGTAFLVGLSIVLWSKWSPTVHSSRLSRFLLLVVVGTTVFMGKTMLESDGILSLMEYRGDFVFYFKMVFWSSSWVLIAGVVRRHEDGNRLLQAIVFGAFLTAVIALICYVTGAGSVAVYAGEGVRASVGASGVSVKQTVVYLAASAFVALYLGRRGGRVIALILLLSTMLSYDRAVQVGVAAAFLWLLVWRLVLLVRGRSLRGERVVIIGGLIATALFSTLGYQSLHTRWTRDLEMGRPGSGRLEFYRVAWEQFPEGSVEDKVLGIGYSGIRETMEEKCGKSIHTHSDFFDLLLGGGLLGLGIYAALFWSLGMYFRGVALMSAECAVMGAVGSVYLVMSLITGLLEATHGMFCLGAIFHCCHVMASSGLECGDAD